MAEKEGFKGNFARYYFESKGAEMAAIIAINFNDLVQNGLDSIAQQSFVKSSRKWWSIPLKGSQELSSFESNVE